MDFITQLLAYALEDNTLKVCSEIFPLFIIKMSNFEKKLMRLKEACFCTTTPKYNKTSIYFILAQL